MNLDYSSNKSISMKYLINKIMFGSWYSGSPNSGYNSSTVTLFTPAEKQVKIKEMFRFACSNQTSRVMNYITTYNIDINSRECVDEYSQTLLHIAVISSDKDFVKKLLALGIDKDRMDCFNRIPVDIAIQQNNKEMVKLLLDNKEDTTFMKSENTRLVIENGELVKDTTMLLNDNKNLTHKYNSAILQMSTHKTSLKRVRSDLDDYMRDNKRLKTENGKLKKDNNVLQNTVTTLRKSNRK